MAKTVHARTIAVQSLDYKYGKIVVPPYEVDIEFTPQEEAALDSGITADMIPSDASQSNKFATEQYVNDKVTTDTARFKGTYNLVSDLGLTTAATYAEISAELGNEISDADNNDYCYVQVPIDDATPIRIQKTDRYKFDGTDWAYEFTVSDADLAPYRAFKPEWTTDTTLLEFCQDVISDPSVIVGDLFLGSLTCSGLPTGMSNEEVSVQVTQGLAGKVLLLSITSTNLSPFYWQQSFYNDTLYGWKSWLVEHQDISGKADIVSGGTENNFFAIDANGNLKDSGKNASDFDASGAASAAKSEVIGTSQDAKTADTIFGAKAFATDAVAAEALRTNNFAAIVALASDPNAGVTTGTTNPEWKLVYTDAEDKILIGKRQNNTWYIAADLDDILDAIIDSYGS